MGGRDKIKGYVKAGADWTKTQSKRAYAAYDKKDRQLKAETGKGAIHTCAGTLGDHAGKVFSTPLDFIGKKTNTPFVSEVGKALHGTTRFGTEIAGQTIQGAVKALQGVATWNGGDIIEGGGEFAAVAGRSVGAFVKTASFTAGSTAAVIRGVYQKDYDKLKTGLKGVGKVVIVGAVAFTVFDLVEGDDVSAAEDGDVLMTQNSHLDGQLHQETGIPYKAQTVELPNGVEVTGVFPIFEGVADVHLPEDMYESSDFLHFSYANEQLLEQVRNDTGVASQFTSEQMEQIYFGETPDGYSWHHHEELGRLQLVDEEVHAKSGHSGGRSIWGGGSDAR